jgi:alkylated DNA repair dioxygenase AlkB
VVDTVAIAGAVNATVTAPLPTPVTSRSTTFALAAVLKAARPPLRTRVRLREDVCMAIAVAFHPAFHPDPYQACLFANGEPSVDTTFSGAQRTWLDESTWIELVPAWMAGADTVFDQLADSLPWRQRKVVMWDRRVDEPRLTAWWGAGEERHEPLPILADARVALSERYDKPFDSIGFNLYRDGRDSVAWHGDRERFHREDPTVAIVSVGARRAFHMRPRCRDASTTTRSRQFVLGHGDLFVMGGACQHDWEHCVPKVAHAEGPRLSIMFRHHQGGGRDERVAPVSMQN